MDRDERVLRDRWTLVDGRPLYARVACHSDPAAPTVVLVHGAFISSRYMVRAATRLAAHVSVYAPDLPGYGKSAHPPRTPTVAGYAAVLVRWMEAVGLARVALVGHSFGCQIVATLAVRYPERVSRIILVGPTVDPAHHTLRQQAARLLVDGTREPARYLPLLLGDCVTMGLREALHVVRVVLDDRIEDQLPHLHVPTLVVRGERDPLVPQRWADVATRLLPAGRLAVIPGVAHVAHYTAPDQFVALAGPFLTGAPDHAAGEAARAGDDGDAGSL